MPKKPLPDKRQLEFLDWEFGVFFHFGIRSFFPGYRDWDQRDMPLEAFCPDALDCEQWIRLSKEAGARYAILVCKHHDGFANWPSAYTAYSVKNTPWMGGQGDVVRCFVDACRKYGLKVGLYYSPAQKAGTLPFSDGKEYDDYFINQIGELLTRYGKIDYLWFDGCGSENHRYDEARIVRAIRSMQKEILIFNMWDPDTRWIGNEDGYASMNHTNTVHALDFSVNTTEKEALRETRFLPAECDFRMRSTWFDCEENEDTVKEADELLGIYEMSVGRGANFLLNIGPDCHGQLPKKDAERLAEFGALLKKRYGTPLSDFGALQREDEDQWSIHIHAFEGPWNAHRPVLVNHVVLMEDLTGGDAVEEFALYASLPGSREQFMCIYRGNTIGHKHICTFPTVRTEKIVLKITKKCADAGMRAMTAYYQSP